MRNITPPLVSVCCHTYNHAPYIRQCLDGFVMQKTKFSIEVIIHDDASTDGTTDIIREYEQKYPEIIKAIYQTENQHLQGINIFMKFIFPRMQGKYLAFCEGDDYWIDEYKLQKQFEFMEANEDFSICFHPVKVFKEEEGIFVRNNTVPDVPDTTDIKTLAVENFINTPSVMYRFDKKVFDDLVNFPVLAVGDYLYHMLFAKNGKIKKLPDTMAVYRVHKLGIWSSKTPDYTHPIYLKLIESLIIYFNKEPEVSGILKEQYSNIVNGLFGYYAVSNGGIIPKDIFVQIMSFSEEMFYSIITKNIVENCIFKETVYYSLNKRHGITLFLTIILRFYRKVNYVINQISHCFKSGTCTLFHGENP